MKTHHISKHIVSRLLVLMVAMLYFAPAFAQDSQQHAIYNYRNDGDFNAWLDIDVEKITYSCTDLDGVEHDDIVVQEVWTPDSVYRIPISAIDSIGFRAPKPEMKEGIFHITEDHLPYAVSVEDLTVTFRSSIPTSLLPSIGQVVISDVYDEPFEIGFAGRVKNVVNSNGTITVICEEVGLGDVYDQLIYVGKTNAYEDDADYSKAARAPRKIKIYDNGVIDVPLGKFSLKVSDGSDASVELSAKPSLTVDYLVAYNVKGVQNQFKVVAKPKVEYGLDYKIKVKKSKSLEDYLAFIPIETGVPGLRIKVRFGAFLDLEGSVSLDGNMTYTTETTCGFDSNIDENHGFFYSVDSGWEDPEVSLELEGSLFCGPVVQVSAYIIYEKGFPCVKFNLKPGVEFSGKIVASSDGISEYGFNAYDMLKDSKLSLGGKLKAESSASVFGKKFDLLGYSLSPDWLRFDFLLFPKFTKPELKNNSNFTPTSLYSEVSGQTLFTTNVGMAVYDEFENPVSEDISIYNYVEKPTTTYVSHNMVDYSSGKYLVRPLVKNIFGTFPASPVAEFTVPEPVSLETTTITVQKDKAQRVAVNGGWGDYSVTVLDKSVCTAELKQEGDSYYIQIVGKKDGGSTSVTLKDLRSQRAVNILVAVSNQQTISSCPDNNHPHMIDLGLPSGTKWACCNVGAEKPDDYGSSFAWGETRVKDSYTEENYLDGKGTDYNLGKDIAGTQYDAATVNWGSPWVMPNLEKMNELVDNCTSEWTTENGVNGRRFTGPNGTSIFFPATGYDGGLWGVGSLGYYWVSTHHESNLVNILYFDDGIVTIGPNLRDYGRSVRPVMSDAPVYPDLQVSQTQVNIDKGSSTTVEITSGSGEYGVTNLNSSIARGTLQGTTITISALSEGNAKVVATDMQTGQKIIIEITVTIGGDIVAYTSCPDNHHPHLIDLGLPSGTKWACCNVGAQMPEDYGGYFAWGETKEKTSYTEENYLDGKGTSYDVGNDIAGTQYDAATANWGSPWVMPNKEQMKELNNCASEWTTENGVNGRRFTGPNGASIFLPAAGLRWRGGLNGAGSVGDYWSSTPHESGTDSSWGLYFDSGYVYTSYGGRHYGQSVRPVRKN